MISIAQEDYDPQLDCDFATGKSDYFDRKIEITYHKSKGDITIKILNDVPSFTANDK